MTPTNPPRDPILGETETTTTTVEREHHMATNGVLRVIGQTVVVKRDYRMALSSSDLVALLRAAGYDVPEDATRRVFVEVPGGGDWSNTTLSLDEAPLNIRWTKEEVEES